MGRNQKEQLTAFNLVIGTLGMILIAMPWTFDEAGEPIAIWSAAFSGTLVMRLGYSAALHFREWKARAEVAIGAWLLSAPWLLHLGSLSRVTWAHIIVGLTVIGVAAVGLGIKTTQRIPLDLGRHGGARPC
jgi:hypothetical protein